MQRPRTAPVTLQLRTANLRSGHLAVEPRCTGYVFIDTNPKFPAVDPARGGCLTRPAIARRCPWPRQPGAYLCSTKWLLSHRPHAAHAFDSSSGASLEDLDATHPRGNRHGPHLGRGMGSCGNGPGEGARFLLRRRLRPPAYSARLRHRRHLRRDNSRNRGPSRVRSHFAAALCRMGRRQRPPAVRKLRRWRRPSRGTRLERIPDVRSPTRNGGRDLRCSFSGSRQTRRTTGNCRPRYVKRCGRTDW